MIVILIATLGVIAAFFVKGALDDKKNRERFRRKIRKGYGQLPSREYRDGELKSIPGYFEKHQKEYQIDDITWNDLDLDEIFVKMNHTWSSAGQEYLYYLLHTPSFSEEELMELEERVLYFASHPKEREDLQVTYARLGSTGKYSIYDYLDYLDELGERNSLMQVLLDLLLIPAIALLILSPSFGLMALLALCIYNMYSYMQQKREIDPYLVSFSYVRRILDFAQEAVKQDIPVLEKEMRELKELGGRFAKFKKSAALGMRGSNSAGDPLSILMDYVNMLLHLDIICFNSMLRELKRHTQDIDRMVTLAGKTEAAIAVASYRAYLKAWCTPVFTEVKELRLTKVYHPLLKEAVKNDIATQKGVLLTGSNASGKSTFLKAVAVNAILGQTIHTCAAQGYEGRMSRVFTSMALKDDLEGGDSYYIVEIKALKRILDEADRNSAPILCFVDEVLRGTNTVERIAASTQVLQSLERPGVMCFAATHDIELTDLLEKSYNNYHFKEDIVEGDIVFPYKLFEGKATTRNAIRLLGVIGYDASIIERAEAMAAYFVEHGLWKQE